ncbi:MAG: serine--tRNA ligase [SAR86 cluster bacterium]|uniref:Serine--tRNA ligase n=1 Tax=SAR86 cluster bacterium TaxID=2030880 RepID=A0A520MAX0_9GAMM|nr:MAG: serine--tRNA ligase [SAR86 cluster bacterium]
MLDLKILRETGDEAVIALAKKGYALDLNKFNDLDEKRKTLQVDVEFVQSERKKLSNEFAALKKEGASTDNLKKDIDKLNEGLKSGEEALKHIQNELEEFLLDIPNLPHPDLPEGSSEEDNLLVRKVGEPSSSNKKDHIEITQDIDSELAVKLAGTRFSVLKNDIAKLQRGLIDLMLNLAIKNGYQENYVPFIANADSLRSTGQLPKFEEDLFKLSNDMYLIPTAEVPLTNFYKDSIIDPSDLPIRLTAHTPCFRSEAGSYGKDTKGLIRQHQFEKVELVQIVHPDQSYQALEELLSHAEEVLQLLELPYQVVELCGGDLGFSSAKTYDIEVWMPSQNKYREISSCSNFIDFQARRGKIRIKDGKNKILAHTINGSALAAGRALIAVIENNFDGKDSIKIPTALKEFMGKESISVV